MFDEELKCSWATNQIVPGLPGRCVSHAELRPRRPSRRITIRANVIRWIYSTGGRGGEESSNRSGRRGTHRTGGVMPDSRRLAGGSAAKAFRFNDKFAGPLEAAHCQNGSRRCVHKSGVICKIMRVLQPWTHMDTDFPMTLYENQFIRSYGNRCPPVSSVSKGYPVFTAKSGLSSAPFHPRTPHRFSREYPR